MYVSVQFSSVAQLCLTLDNPMGCSMPSFPVLRYLPEFAQTHVHQIGDAIQPSSIVPFSSCLQPCPASGSFLKSQFFPSSGQSISVSYDLYIYGLSLWLSWWRICLQCGRPGVDPWVGKIPWRRERLPTPVFWPGEFHGLYSQSMGSQRVRHEWVTFTSLHIYVYMINCLKMFNNC